MTDTITAPISITEVTISAPVIIGQVGPTGPAGVDGTLILSGTGDPPDPTGLDDGTIYLKYTP